jgi:hypothetical protein
MRVIFQCRGDTFLGGQAQKVALREPNVCCPAVLTFGFRHFGTRFCPSLSWKVTCSDNLDPNTTMGDKDEGGSGTEVYVLDKTHAWIPARLLEQGKDTARVSIPEYPEEAKIIHDGGAGATGWREETVKLKNYPGGQLPLANMAGTELNAKEDMCDLPFLHEVRTHRSARVIMVSCGPLTSLSCP